MKERLLSLECAKTFSNEVQPSQDASYRRHTLSLPWFIRCHYFCSNWMVRLICLKLWIVSFKSLWNIRGSANLDCICAYDWNIEIRDFNLSVQSVFKIAASYSWRWSDSQLISWCSSEFMNLQKLRSSLRKGMVFFSPQLAEFPGIPQSLCKCSGKWFTNQFILIQPDKWDTMFLNDVSNGL